MKRTHSPVFLDHYPTRRDIDPVFLRDPSTEEQAALTAAAVSRYARHHRAALEAAHGPGPGTLLLSMALLGLLMGIASGWGA